jgi:lysophospholipase L1-like esterase
MNSKVLMIGSSIFEQWTNIDLEIENDIINMAVGGTITDYWNENILQVLEREIPDIVMIYSGSNDLNNERSAEQIVRGLNSCIKKIRLFNQGIRIAYFGIIKAPQKADKFDMIDSINSQVRFKLKDQDIYVDTNEVLYADICDVSQFYVEDQLHMTDAAYEALNRYTAPLINEWLV